MLALSFVPFIMVLGNSMLIPVLTDIKRELNITSLEANLILSYFSFSAALIIPFLGFISDRIGRKKVMIPALILYGIGGLISGFASVFAREPYKIIILGRIIQGFGAAGTSPIAMALVSDMFSTTERGRALGIIEASNGIGKVLSPILGSLIAMIAWYFIFFSYSFLTIPVAILIWFVIKEERSHAERKNLSIYFSEIWMILRAKGLSLVVCLFGGFGILFILYGILANISDILGGELKSNLLKRGFIVALPVTTMSIVSYWLGGYLQHKRGIYKRMITYSFFVCIVALLWIPHGKSFMSRLIILEIIGIVTGTALTALNTLVTSCAPPGKRGVITAVYNSCRFLGIAFGPIYFSNFYGANYKLILFTIMTGGMTLLAQQYLQADRMLEYFGAKK
nr:MFS transporter [Anaerosolibacter carboniphilus]